MGTQINTETQHKGCKICPLSSAIGSFSFVWWAEEVDTKWQKTRNLYHPLDPGSSIRQLVCMCLRECACHSIHCQDSDRFLFVHKLLSVISSIFETIKQRREDGWLGNQRILICQQNENESGRWYKCAEWEVAADMSKEQSFVFFLLSFTTLPGVHKCIMWHTVRGLKLQQIWVECQWDSCECCTSNNYKNRKSTGFR